MILLDVNKIWKFIMVGFFFAMASLYIHFFITAPLDQVVLNVRFIVKILLIAVTCNIGIIFLALKCAKKFKVIATVAFLPSMFFTPLIVGLYFIPGFFIIIGVNIYIFIKFNPWKKYENKTVVA